MPTPGRAWPVLALVLLSIGAAPGAAADAAWRQDRFLVGGWVPGPSRSAEQLLRLADLGLDYFHVDYPSLEESRIVTARLDSLATARRGFGLQAIVHVRVPFDDPARIVDNPDPAANWARIARRLGPEAGMNHRSTLGWHLLDEPNERSGIRRVGELSRRFRADPRTRGQLGYCNLFPIIDPATNGGYARDFGKDADSAYVAYLRAYLREFDATGEPAPVLSYDHYPFQESRRPAPSWFRNLELARDAALTFSRPQQDQVVAVWVVVQCTDFRPRGGRMSAHFEPTLLRWQVWSAVAYGVKGIAYWTLRPATDAFSGIGFGRGVFDEANRPTPLFPEIRRLNAELHALGPHLMALDSRGAWHARAQGQRHVESGRWDAAPDAGARDGVRGIATGPGRDDGLVSVYQNRKTGERWLGVFNKSLATSRTFRVQLDAAPSRIERIDSTDGRAVAVPVQGTVFSSGLLAPGGFALFRVPRAS